MKSQEKLTHLEIMDSLTFCFREVISTDVMDRKMPSIINRAKAAAMTITAMHREQIIEEKRQRAQKVLEGAEKQVLNDLKKIS